MFSHDTQGLSEVGGVHEKNVSHPTKDVNQLKDDFKTRTLQVDELTKQLADMKNQKDTLESQLSEMTKQKETDEANCSELEATNVSLAREAE